MEPTDAEKLKAHRAQRLLRWLVVVMITVPVGIFLLQLFGRSH